MLGFPPLPKTSLTTPQWHPAPQNCQLPARHLGPPSPRAQSSPGGPVHTPPLAKAASPLVCVNSIPWGCALRSTTALLSPGPATWPWPLGPPGMARPRAALWELDRPGLGPGSARRNGCEGPGRTHLARPFPPPRACRRAPRLGVQGTISPMTLCKVGSVGSLPVTPVKVTDTLGGRGGPGLLAALRARPGRCAAAARLQPERSGCWTAPGTSPEPPTPAPVHGRRARGTGHGAQGVRTGAAPSWEQEEARDGEKGLALLLVTVSRSRFKGDK